MLLQYNIYYFNIIFVVILFLIHNKKMKKYIVVSLIINTQ